MLTSRTNRMRMRMRMRMGTRTSRGALRQRGMFLIEAVVAILLFMLGIVGMVGLSAQAVATQSDAEYRTLAAQWASQIGQEAWISVSRVGADSAARATAVQEALATFRHQPTGDDCNFSGDAATSAVVTSWVEAVRDAPHGGLPGASAAMQQIRVDSTAEGHNKMTITVCWQVPSNPVKRRHVFATLIN